MAIPKEIKALNGWVLGLIILAILVFALLSTTDILKKSDPSNQNINNSLTAIENSVMAKLGADGNYYCTSTTEPCKDRFWSGFWIGIFTLIILVGLIYLIAKSIDYFFGRVEL